MSLQDYYLTVTEVAHLLKLNPLTIYTYINDGKIAAIKIGRNYRIERIELEKFLNTHKTGGSTNE